MASRAYLTTCWENFERTGGRIDFLELWLLLTPGERRFLGKVADQTWDEAVAEARALGFELLPLLKRDIYKGPEYYSLVRAAA